MFLIGNLIFIIHIVIIVFIFKLIGLTHHPFVAAFIINFFRTLHICLERQKQEYYKQTNYGDYLCFSEKLIAIGEADLKAKVKAFMVALFVMQLNPFQVLPILLISWLFLH